MSFTNRSLSFIIPNRRFLLFGFLLTFASSFGQTYFISLFSAKIRQDFDLSHGDFGTLYAVATLASAVTLIWLGRKVDDHDLRGFALFVTLGLGLACALMAWSPSLLVLGLAIYALRLFGQGLTGHTAAIGMARYFDRTRGMALSISGLGYPLGEAVFPFAAVSLMAYLSSGQLWGSIALFVLFVITPLIQVLLIGHAARHQRHLNRTHTDAAKTTSTRQFSRRDVLKDRNCYVILLVILAPAFIVTGVFFHQVHLVEIKGWQLSWFAAAFIAFAISQVASSLIAGALIDRRNALGLLPRFLLPLSAGLMVLAVIDNPLAIPIFMLLGGATSGAATTISGALWAEIYGVTHLGAIKALTVAFMVFATALSPAMLGWMIDGGISVSSILGGMALYSVAASLFTGWWFRNGIR